MPSVSVSSWAAVAIVFEFVVAAGCLIFDSVVESVFATHLPRPSFAFAIHSQLTLLSQIPEPRALHCASFIERVCSGVYELPFVLQYPGVVAVAWIHSHFSLWSEHFRFSYASHGVWPAGVSPGVLFGSSFWSLCSCVAFLRFSSALVISHLLPLRNPALTHSPPSAIHASLAAASDSWVAIPRVTAPDVHNPAAVPNPAPIAAADADVCDRVRRWAFSMYVVMSMPNQSGVH